MRYFIRHRMTGHAVAAPERPQSDPRRYTSNRDNARQFTRYVDAFNHAGMGETVVEF